MDDAGDVPDTTEDPLGASSDVTPQQNAAEVERLKAEVAALEAKVDRRAGRRRVGQRARKVLVGVLVVLTALSFTAGAIGVWASRNFLNNDVFAARIGTVIEEQAVQQS